MHFSVHTAFFKKAVLYTNTQTYKGNQNPCHKKFRNWHIYYLKKKTKGSVTAYLNNQIFNSVAEISSWTLIKGGATAIYPIILPPFPNP